MNIALTFAIFGLCFTAMAIGLLISGKTLKKGCSVHLDDCTCRKERKDPEQCSSR